MKVFLTASTAVRARRRSAEIGEAGDDAVAQTMAELGRRDALDSGRVAPARLPRLPTRSSSTRPICQWIPWST